MDRNTIGRDHFLILVRFDQSLLVEEDTRPRPLDYNKAKWDEFVEGCRRGMDRVERDGTVDEWNNSLCEMITDNVNHFIPQKKPQYVKAFHGGIKHVKRH